MSRLYLMLFVVFYFNCNKVIAQDKRGNVFIFGGSGVGAIFTDTARPQTYRYYPVATNHHFMDGHSNICDSAIGNLLLVCNGMILIDSIGNIIENGDSLQPNKIYNHNCCPTQTVTTDGSIILPKGSNGEYYVFVPTITDSAYDYYVVGAQNKVPYDLLQYHVVDMNANGGMGKVVQKNVPLLTHVEMCKVGMMTCKHANGYDWWLLKQALDTNMIYTFLVTKDSVVLKSIQGFPTPHFGYYDLAGQSCFNYTGSKYAFATGGGFMNNMGAHLFISDFDRCYGIVSNVKTIAVPYDSTMTTLDTLNGPMDSLITGICFSPNDSFLYVSRRYNIYQYDLFEPDSNQRWTRIQAGPDTTQLYFGEYKNLVLGPDGRIYVSKYTCSPFHNSVIDYPNKKGMACGFCKLCLRYDPGPCTSAMPNMPNFNMPKKEPCWPLSQSDSGEPRADWSVYPNPAFQTIFIKNAKGKKKTLLDISGQNILSTTKDEIDVNGLSKGLYFLYCDGIAKKVLVE
ncbi:MAG: T9SS type A sorting domain-containing protein [Bacteroidetes bacterium]|nr:T9SS type A sorting domain-containing protein [Bacteroidota bacterium]